MNIMIATPQYGGQCSSLYKRSCVTFENFLTRTGLPHQWVDTVNESLITRGRNIIATTFLNSTCDHLFFIDSDIEFTNEDAAHILTMGQSGTPIACGCYPAKSLGSPFVAFIGKERVKLDDLTGDQPFTVSRAGTGFMLIKREVFERLQTLHPEWQYTEQTIGPTWAFFQDPIEEHEQLSEDYFFCKRATEAGFDIQLHPRVRLGHWGSHRYDGTEILTQTQESQHNGT